MISLMASSLSNDLNACMFYFFISNIYCATNIEFLTARETVDLYFTHNSLYT
jgi:hypothetical protein